MRTIAIVNQKGGCGKTITAINLSTFLARDGRRVLLVDMDPQGHATLGVVRDDPSQSQKTIYDVLAGEPGTASLRDVIISVRQNLDLAPADIRLSALPEKLSTLPGRENRLSKAFEEARLDYDYIVVDCPPSVGLLTFNALKACSEAIIPVEPSFFSVHGIGKQLETLDLLERKTGHEIRARALITLYTGRSEFVKAVAEDIRTHLVDRCFTTVIRFSVKLSEAAGHAQPIAEFSPRSAGCSDYRALVQEILAQESPAVRVEQAAVEASPVSVSEPVSEPVSELVLEPEQVVPIPANGSHGVEPPMELRPQAAGRPLPTDGGVLFTLEAPDARCVQLAADFNGWVADGNEMQANGRVWRKLVPLPPGRYHYRFVVDGGWITDPLNTDQEVMPSGIHDSVITVEGNSPTQ
jgi:chromosome partitioning protein